MSSEGQTENGKSLEVVAEAVAEAVAEEVKVVIKDELEDLVKDVKSRIQLQPSDPIPTIILRVMQVIECTKQIAKGENKKAVALRVLEQLEIPAETRETLKFMIVTGVVGHLIDSFVDVAKKQFDVQSKEEVKGGCCVVM